MKKDNIKYSFSNTKEFFYDTSFDDYYKQKELRLLHLLGPNNQIVLWFGESDDIPTGWFVCDGTNDTPNLTGKFNYEI